ncbi:heat shock protein HtpX [mine drainage metagenome]|uniref:Heat shock protein HtpX n=1 Tax=mine drainage metagenome TaxID=410659 RepID=T0YND1_9ZZZZ
MQRKLGSDRGLTLRMALTMFLLAVVYLIFVGVMAAVMHLGIATIGVIVVVLLAAQYYFSDRMVLTVLKAQMVTPQQYPQLYDMVGRLAQLTGIPVPKVAVIPSRVPNALATGRDPKHAVIAVTTGIINQLEPKELEAVLAHELSHVIHRDVKVMAMAGFFATVASLIVQSGMWFGMFGGFGYGGGGRGRGRDQGEGDDRDHPGRGGGLGGSASCSFARSPAIGSTPPTAARP